jgi:hypothetical protein
MLPRSPFARVSIMRLAWCWLHSLSASSMPCSGSAGECQDEVLHCQWHAFGVVLAPLAI